MNVSGKPGSRNNSKTKNCRSLQEASPTISLWCQVGKETWEGNPTSPPPKQSRKSFFGSYKSVKNYHCFPCSLILSSVCYIYINWSEVLLLLLPADSLRASSPGRSGGGAPRRQTEGPGELARSLPDNKSAG